MSPHRWLPRVVLVLALLLAAPPAACAQSELQTWLNPELGKLMLRGQYAFTYYPNQPVERQSTGFRLLEHEGSILVPIYQDSRNEWTLSAGVGVQEIHTQAILPSTGERFPDELWDIQVGAAYRHKFDNGWIGGASLAVGSASDRPFNSIDEVIVKALALLRVPHGARNAWLFSLIYQSDEEIFSDIPNIPVPGIAYQWVPSDRLALVIGVPFSSIEFKPIDKLTLEAQYFPVRRVRARATYEVFRPLRVYVGFDWDSDHWLRADRRHNGDQFVYYEKRFTGGVRFDLRHVGVVLSGGYAFDRFYFEGNSYSDRDFNRVDIESGPFLNARLNIRF